MSETYIFGKECRERYLQQEVVQSGGFSCGGVSFLQPPYEITRSDPAVCQILWCRAGTGMLEMENGPVELHPGDVVLFPKNVPHHYYLNAGEWHICWLQASENFFPCFEVTVRHQDPTAEGWLVPFMEHFCTSADDRLARQAGQTLRALIDSMRELFLNTAPDEYAIRFARLKRLVEQHPGNAWSIEKLMRAGDFYCSAIHFNRLCCRYWGMSAIRQVNTLRMEEAARLLKFTCHRTKEIASRLGYANENAFSAAFHRYFGVAPGTFRRGGNAGD